ncbi:TPA: LysR family transcriptional regulator [Raoultella ornithinolytica]|nr:LysR family transcriptional regulator [Raoultella ornithinolytica]HAT1616671.1 LysR family transcriptional regulator [Raoultella ornithinolytica]
MKSDIRNLDLNLLKAMDALLDERSVTRAATRLSLTQPAVSGMLTRLREAFNDPLFIRAPHVSVSRFLLLPEILAISDMMAVVPSRLAKMAGGMCIAPPPLTIPGFSKCMAWHERSHRNPAQQWLRELLWRTSQN